MAITSTLIIKRLNDLVVDTTIICIDGEYVLVGQSTRIASLSMW